MNTRQIFYFIAVFAVPMNIVEPTLAGTIVVPTIDRGSVTSTGLHQATVSNYITKGIKSISIPTELRDFFVFDLTGITNEVLEATFRVYNPPDGYNSPDTFETLELNPINKVPITTFFSDDPGTGAFLDLADGATYGSRNIQETDVDVFIDIPLNTAALFDINLRIINSIPYFGFGGRLTTLDLSDAIEEKVFTNTGSMIGPGDGNSVLILSGPKIPEPSTCTLALAALCLAMSRRRIAARKSPVVESII